MIFAISSWKTWMDYSDVTQESGEFPSCFPRVQVWWQFLQNVRKKTAAENVPDDWLPIAPDTPHTLRCCPVKNQATVWLSEPACGLGVFCAWMDECIHVLFHIKTENLEIKGPPKTSTETKFTIGQFTINTTVATLYIYPYILLHTTIQLWSQHS